MSYMTSKIGAKDKLYHPINKNKYMGKEGYAVCRSSWEIKVCQWLDGNKAVLQWKSEPFGIWYFDPTQKDPKGLPKRRRYYPDFIAKIQNRNGKIDIWLIEVKPHKETVPPRKNTRKKKKTLIYEDKTWQVNLAKWKAAQNYCDRKGWRFKILTEKEILT